MTRTYPVIILGLIALLVFPATSRPVLIAVRLPDQTAVRSWQPRGIPTFELVEHVAFAELDETEVRELQKAGFDCRIIDDDPWTAPYFVGRQRSGERSIPGRVIWQGLQTSLWKIPVSEAGRVFTEGLRLREMPRREVPDRRWNAMLQDRTLVFRPQRYPFLQALIDQVSGDSLAAYTQRLEAFRTRLMLTDSSYASSQWMADMFASWGYPVAFDSFYVEGSWVGEFPGTGYERSVIATVQGAHTPDDHVILGGHHDSIVWPDFWSAFEYAPGADDNATGVATAMEAARIFRNYSWDRTIQFMGFGGEELGLFGSWDYAIESVQSGRDIRGVIDPDMIGYLDDGVWELNLGHADHAAWLAGLCSAVGQLFAPSIAMYPVLSYDGSDHAPFNAVGYSAIACEERWIPNNPNWHVDTDTWEQITPDYFTEVAKVCIATTAILALFPDEVVGTTVVDVGNGADLLVRWTPGTEWDIQGYRVYWRTGDGSYTEEQSTLVDGSAADSCLISNLTADVPYFLVVVARDTDGYESFMGVEVSESPCIAPAAPASLTATPIRDGVMLAWEPNTEIDLAGYRAYRRSDTSSAYETLTTDLIMQSGFIDSSLSFGEYYYVVKAFDLEGNAGTASEEVFARPITLDQGIIMVDETRNHSTLPDDLQDDFYRYVFSGADVTEYEFGSAAQRPRLADLAPFSTLVWHAEDFAEFLASGNVDDFRRYLDAGGNIWFIGWKMMGDLTNDGNYPKDFEPGSFVYDYLKVSHVSLSGIGDAIGGAHGVLGYPDLTVQADSIGVPAWNGTLRYAEAYTTVNGDAVYLIDALDDQNPFEGLVCGVRHLGADYRTVLLGLPLYYMGREQARSVARQVLQDFGEPLGGEPIPDSEGLPADLRLIAASPNPVTTRLTIRYWTPQEGRVKVALYDLAGREVCRLVDKVQGRGTHMAVWTPPGQNGTAAVSGVYLCRVTQGNSSASTRIVAMP